MYTQEQYKRALSLYDECGSITKTIGSSNFVVDSPKSIPFLLLLKCLQMLLRNPL